MASTRNIEAPGIEIRETDRSKYTMQNNSLPNAPAVLAMGFADKGENYSVKWINTINTLTSTYGRPTTEFEQIFHNACIEILNRGGICLASKLPYDNNESNKYTYCDYSIDASIHHISSYSGTLSSITKYVDSELTSFIELSSTGHSGQMSLDDFDNLKTRKSIGCLKDKLRVVDISKSRFQKADFNCVSSMSGADSMPKWTNECLGLFPVIVTSPNALYWQYMSIHDSMLSASDGNDVCLSDFNCMSELTCMKPQQSAQHKNVDLSQRIYNEVYHPASAYKTEETLSKFAAQLFPQMSYASSSHLDTKHLKSICIVVIQAYADKSCGNKISYQVAESFVGSLDRRAKDDNGASLFIDDIVNSQSQLINVFSNADQNLFDRAAASLIRNQTSTMLGFFNEDCTKMIDIDKSISKPITTILDSVSDPNQFPFDLIVDAGMSNIAQYMTTCKGGRCEAMSFDDTDWEFRTSEPADAQTSSWKRVITTFDNFCKFTRKDCMFIADGLRPFCLAGNQKIVRKTKIGSSVQKDILPKLRYMAGLNSSFSAGYCNWFQIADYYSGDQLWCPPSVKAASAYIYCDTYFHTWDAPAGMIRGIVSDAIDVAFNPTNDEAGKIYSQGWNYAISYPIDGIILEGQKTFQTNKTALDRVNVRRLLLSLEKKIVRASKYFLYEGNTPYQRQKFVDAIRPMLENAVSGGGLSEYAIRCDEQLNTPQVIDNGELRCAIAVRPVKTIEFIYIDLVTTNQTASVTEEVMK